MSWMNNQSPYKFLTYKGIRKSGSMIGCEPDPFDYVRNVDIHLYQAAAVSFYVFLKKQIIKITSNNLLQEN